MSSEPMEDKLTVPEQVYDKPRDVTADASLDETSKIDILTAWKANEEALMRASGEGMAGGESPNLQLVINELAKLQA